MKKNIRSFFKFLLVFFICSKFQVSCLEQKCQPYITKEIISNIYRTAIFSSKTENLATFFSFVGYINPKALAKADKIEHFSEKLLLNVIFSPTKKYEQKKKNLEEVKNILISIMKAREKYYLNKRAWVKTTLIQVINKVVSIGESFLKFPLKKIFGNHWQKESQKHIEAFENDPTFNKLLALHILYGRNTLFLSNLEGINVGKIIQDKEITGDEKTKFEMQRSKKFLDNLVNKNKHIYEEELQEIEYKLTPKLVAYRLKQILDIP